MPQLSSSCMTHKGAVRQRNEDAILSLPEIGLWAVAHGMGGHEAGDFASQCLLNHILSFAKKYSGLELVERVHEAIYLGNNEILNYAAVKHNNAIVGTTLVILILENDRFHCFWSGDSRCYILRSNHLSMITKDHTEAENLVAEGKLSVNDEAYARSSNILTHAIGVELEPVIEYKNGFIYQDDKFLLCSDGINKVFSDDYLETSLILEEDIEHLNQKLMLQALDLGARDNVSSIIVSL